MPHFQYCDYVYDACNRTQSNKLQIAQNNTLRAILNVDERYTATKVHEETGIAYLANIRKRSTCTEVYKAINDLSTPSMSKLVRLRENTRTLRSNDTYPLDWKKIITCADYF